VSSDRDVLLARAADLAEEGYQTFKSGDANGSSRLNEESLELARQADDPQAIVRALAGLMRLGLRAGSFDEVEGLAQQCDEVAEAAGDGSLRRLPLHMRAEAARMKGNFDRARELYDTSIALNRELGNEAMVGVEMANKSWVEINTGRLEDAERLIRGSMDLTPVDDAYGIAFSLLGLARVQLELGREQGAETLGAAESVLEREGLVWDPAEESEYERTLELGRGVAGARLDKLRACGHSVDPADL
jgi:tetratricopeptide (TPR) repeat protein